MSRLLLAVIACYIFLLCNITQAIANDNIFNITEFHKKIDASQRMSLKITGSEEPVSVVFLLIDAESPARIMQIFDDDVCVTAVFPDANFMAYYTCRSGADMRVSFNCRNNCYMQGEHSQKGRWKDVYNYRINQNLPLDEILEFAGYTEASSQQENSANQDVQKTRSTLDNASKLDKAKSTCTELGFTLGTEKHGECVLKMIDN